MQRLTKFEIDAIKEMVGQLNKHLCLDIRIRSYTRFVEETPRVRRALDRFGDAFAGTSYSRFEKAYTNLLDAVDTAIALERKG